MCYPKEAAREAGKSSVTLEEWGKLGWWHVE